METAEKQADLERPARFTSHALVEVRRYKYLWFGVHSGILLDLSLAGCKLEFTSEVKAAPGQQFWLTIPLQPLGIYSPSRFMCKIECRWFDETRYRIGAVFVDLDKSSRQLVEQIIEALKTRQSDS